MDQYLLTIFKGVDASVLPGLTDYNWIQLLSEIGTDLKKWKTFYILVGFGTKTT